MIIFSKWPGLRTGMYLNYLEARGPFFERPGNFSGQRQILKSKLALKTCHGFGNHLDVY